MTIDQRLKRYHYENLLFCKNVDKSVRGERWYYNCKCCKKDSQAIQYIHS